jgi:predicted amidohydrolase YtcJ
MTPEADLVLVGAPVYTADPARPWADAVAVRAGRVAAVGPEAEVAGLRGPATRMLRLDGGLVLPGFQDAHVHTAAGGLELAQCDLHGVEPQGYAAAVARYAAGHPDVPWVVGGGWVMDAFGTAGPHLATLDAVVGDRPVLLESTDGHSVWVNSRALELADVTRATPDPPRGRIGRDAAGEPTGVLHEAAKALVDELAPQPDQADWEAAIERGQAHLHRLGITAWQDAAVSPEMLAAYRALAERGRLTGRAVAALRWRVEAGLAQLADLVERRRTGTVGRLRASAVKIFADGVFENRTAAMLAPTWTATAAPAATWASPCSAPRSWPGWSPPWTARASACTSTPSATGPCATPWTPSRPRPPPTAAATPATRSPTSSSSTPRTGPASAAWGWSPTPSRSGPAWTATCAS